MTSARARAKERTREDLLRSALELFAEQGIEGPSLDAVCERAGRTRGAFYVHFTDREALVVAVAERILRGYVTALVDAATVADTLDRFSELLVRAATVEEATFEDLGTRHFRLVLEASARFPAARERFVAILAEAVGLLAARVEAEQGQGSMRAGEARGMAEVLVAVLIGLLAFQEGGPERVERVRAALAGLLRG